VAKHIINLVKVQVTVDRLVGPVLPQATLREQETPRRGGPVLGEPGVGPSRVAAGIAVKGPNLAWIARNKSGRNIQSKTSR
jgi:hypothetical protein